MTKALQYARMCQTHWMQHAIMPPAKKGLAAIIQAMALLHKKPLCSLHPRVPIGGRAMLRAARCLASCASTCSREGFLL